jgi:hypothetical protein
MYSRLKEHAWRCNGRFYTEINVDDLQGFAAAKGEGK